MSDTPVAGLSEAKQALFRKLMRERGLAHRPPEAIPPRADAEWAPLSYAQRSLWFIHELEGANATYNMGGGLRIDGDLRVDALRTALDTVAARHEVLRGVFARGESGPVQRFAAQAPTGERVFPLELRRVESGDEAEALERGIALIEAFADMPFDLERGPLIRALLVDLGEDRHLLYLCMHHIISDAWSMEVLFREILQGYRAAASGATPSFPPLQVQYGDYAVWQGSEERQEALLRQEAYWRKRLDGVPHALELPTDRPRPARLSVRGGAVPIRVDAATAARLDEVARASGATPFMALLACWQLLLWSLSSQDDFVVGVSSVNRPRKELEPLIGYFVNTLAIRCPPESGQGFAAHLVQVREAVAEAFAHQDLPFERVVALLGVERALDRAPLAQARFAFANVRQDSAELPGLRFSPLTLEREDTNAKCDLLLVMWPDEGRYAGALQYSADLFDAAGMQRLAARFGALIAAVCANPELPLGDLSYLPEKERSLLETWRHPVRAHGAGRTVGNMFAGCADAHPDTLAVVDASRSMTRTELAAAAASLAQTLRARGIGRGHRVGLCTARTCDFAVGLLGTLIAGAAYVPLDRSMPRDRLSAIVGEAALSVVLHDEEGRAAALSLGMDALSIAQAMDAGQGAPWRDDAQAEDAAYLIFTSGTTGKPKGVQVAHRSLHNYVLGIRDVLALAPGAESLALSTISADLGNTAIFAALCDGGVLRLLPEEASLDASRLGAYLAERPVDCLKIVPSHFEMLLRTGEPQQLLPRSTLVFGGEQLPASLLSRVRSLAPHLRVVNHYGPTETTIGVLTWLAEPLDAGMQVPVGRPLPNVAAYLLDRFGRQVGIGEIGELHLGGDCLADGYYGDPVRTLERFVVDPFLSSAGSAHPARMYRTGDLARWREDGTLVFLGRRDLQVKIRGHRVELGEIEAALRGLEGVRDAAVRTRSGERVDEATVAFVVLDDSTAADIVRERLRTFLPEHMVPERVVALDALPLNANGKLDRARLHLPVATDAVSHTESARIAVDAAPDASLRAAVRDVWRDVLKHDDFDDEARFFDIGGHSLRATLVVFRLRKSVAPQLSVRDLFEHPTVATLAAFIASTSVADAAADGTAAVPGVAAPTIGVQTRPDRIRPTLTQERLWFVDQVAAGSAAYNIPLGLRLHGTLNLPALRGALDAVHARHEVLRCVFETHGGAPYLAVRDSAVPGEGGMPFALEDIAAMSPEARETTVRAAVIAESTTPFALDRGPLARTRLLRLSESEHVLLLTMHHIVSDGWSNEVISRELAELYTAACEGREPALAPLPIQYIDYALWERRRADEGGFDQDIAYWRRRLAGAADETPLPLDRARGEDPRVDGGSERFRIPADVRDGVLALASAEGATPFVVMQAAFKLLLSKYSGREDIVVGTTHANRGHAEAEGLVGFFVNQVPLRSTFDAGESVRALLRREAASVAEDFAHHALPFNVLVSALGQERSLERTPVFQALFVMQNVPPHALRLPGLSLERVEFEVSEAKFDVSLFVMDADDGMHALLTFRRALFDDATMRRMAARYVELLRNMVSAPDHTTGQINMIPNSEHEEATAAKERLHADKLGKLKSIRRRTVTTAAAEMVRSCVFDEAKGYPLCVTPARDDVDLTAWAAANRGWIEGELRRYGAILFRGFARGHAQVDLESFAAAVSDRLIDEYGDLPRDSVSGRVYKSTPYPSDKAILIHNESSHLHRYPTKIFFSCIIPASVGGESPIVDCRAVLRRLDPQVVETFRRRRLKYVRNYVDAVDVSWEHFFQTSDRSAVEAYCRRNDIDFEWVGETGLRTSVVCDAVKTHQVTGEEVFFNQICLHHISCVDPATRQSLLRLYGMDGLPRNVYYGDGEPIEDEVVAHVMRVVDELKVEFLWERHDIVMVDNVMCAHARNPFEGERKIVVAIADIFDDRTAA